MEKDICDCPHCDCVVPATATQVNGKTYCCEACATSHPDNQPCQSGDCNCHRHNWGGIKT